MKHFDYEINLFIDEELPEGNQKELFSHLAGCGECRSTFRELLLLKEKSRAFFTNKLDRIKNKPKTTNLFYKIGFYTSAAAAILLLFILVAAKPKETTVTKNGVRVDTVFIQKEIPNAQNYVNQANSFNPGKKESYPEATLKNHLLYVMGLRTVRITEADIIKTKNGS